MSESVSSPWIRDYFVGVAETYGAQLFNTPLSLGKKKVQLTDFLTYEENSYIWAWISDKDYRVSVRISKDAVDLYKSNHGRNIIDCRFYVVSISSYRPMFSPRPLGPNSTGNTRVSHLSLEVGLVRSVGVGGHLFGNPRDLELDERMKEWVSGLRQDGGGGNVLKLRKQQELAQNQKASLLPSPPPFSLYAPVSQCPSIKPVEDVAKPKPDRPQDLKRAYTKRWRAMEADGWKLAFKPVAEERPDQTEPSLVPVELRSDTTSQLESRHQEAFVSLTSPRMSSPSRSQRQGTPTNWSPSNRGSPAAQDKATAFAFGEDGIERHEPEALTSAPALPFDIISEGHDPVDTAITSDICSLQPPTPAQRINHSSPPRSTPPPRSPSELIAHSPLPSQQLPSSFPPPLSSSLPSPSSLLPVPTSIRKNIRRKVPHPGLPIAQLDPAKKGLIQILVPNSDTSGAGSSQSYSQSQLSSQLQQLQCLLLSQPAALPSSLANNFEPPDTSTPREGQQGGPARCTPNMLPESVPQHCAVDEQETAPTGERNIERPNTGKQEQSGSTRPMAPNASKIEALEVGTSDTEEEADQLHLARTTTRTEVDLDSQTGNQDRDRRDTDADHGVNHLSVDKAEVRSVPQSSPRRGLSSQPADSVIRHPSSNQHEADRASPRCSPQPLEPSMPRSSMHSLFSDSLGDEQIRSSQVGRGSPHVPSYDAEAWKEPSFLARKRGKGKALGAEELDTPKIKTGKRRRGSAGPELPVQKRAKVAKSEGRQMTRGQVTIDRVQPQDIDAPATRKISSSDRPSTSSADTAERMAPPAVPQSSKPRLANLVVSFGRIDLGKKVPVSMVDLAKDIKDTLLRTGRIRTLGKEVEEDGEAYLCQ